MDCRSFEDTRYVGGTPLDSPLRLENAFGYMCVSGLQYLGIGVIRRALKWVPLADFKAMYLHLFRLKLWTIFPQHIRHRDSHVTIKAIIQPINSTQAREFLDEMHRHIPAQRVSILNVVPGVELNPYPLGEAGLCTPAVPLDSDPQPLAAPRDLIPTAIFNLVTHTRCQDNSTPSEQITISKFSWESIVPKSMESEIT